MIVTDSIYIGIYIINRSYNLLQASMEESKAIFTCVILPACMSSETNSGDCFANILVNIQGGSSGVVGT